MSGLALLGFEWLRLQWLPALAVVSLVALLVLYGLRARRLERENLVAPRHQARFFRNFSPNRARLRAWLAISALLFAVLALLGPVRGYTLREVRRKGLDLALCMDTSRSMLVEDVRPNRLQRAQREVAGLLDRLEGDRAALLAFSGDVREVAPLTHDRNTLKSFAATLSPEDNLRGGTDIGAAIARALELFDGRSGAHEAIVILTDG
ncbi:MAG: vWA domain-containing protein, partial [Planctomycetia bacterium]